MKAPLLNRFLLLPNEGGKVTLHIHQAKREIFKIEAPKPCQLVHLTFAEHSARGNILKKRILCEKPLLLMAVT